MVIPFNNTVNNEQWACNMLPLSAIQRSVEVHMKNKCVSMRNYFCFSQFSLLFRTFGFQTELQFAATSQGLNHFPCQVALCSYWSWIRSSVQAQLFDIFKQYIQWFCIKNLNNFSFQQNRIRHSSHINFNLLIHLSNNYVMVHIRSIT